MINFQPIFEYLFIDRKQSGHTPTPGSCYFGYILSLGSHSKEVMVKDRIDNLVPG